MNGKFNKFYRTGKISESNYELILNQLKSSLGSAYNTTDNDNSAINIELNAYAKELDSINDFYQFLANRFDPNKCNDQFLQEITKQLNYLNFDNLSSRSLCELHYKTFKNKLTFQLLNDTLKKLAANTFKQIYFIKSTQFDPSVDNIASFDPNIDSFYANIDFNFGSNYLGILIKNTNIENATNPILDTNITGGISYSYDKFHTDNFSDSRSAIIILVKNLNSEDFFQNINLMKTFLNRFLPIHIMYSFADSIGFILDDGTGLVGSSLDSYTCLS